MAHRQKTINDFFGSKSSGTTPQASQASRKRTHDEAFDDPLNHFSLNLPPSPTSTSPQNRLSPQLSVSPSSYRASTQGSSSSLAPRTLFPPEPKRQRTTSLFLDDEEVEEQLTPEELERIERNKQAALARKKAAELAGVAPIVMSQTPKAIKVIPLKAVSSQTPSASQPAPVRKPIVLASPSKIPVPKLASSQTPAQTQKQTPLAVPMVVETIDDEEEEPKVSSFFGSTSPTSSPRPLRLGRFSPRSQNNSQNNSSQGSSQGSQPTSLSPIESLTPTSPQHSSHLPPPPPIISLDPSPPKTNHIPQPRVIPSTPSKATTSSSSPSKAPSSSASKTPATPTTSSSSKAPSSSSSSSRTFEAPATPKTPKKKEESSLSGTWRPIAINQKEGVDIPDLPTEFSTPKTSKGTGGGGGGGGGSTPFSSGGKNHTEKRWQWLEDIRDDKKRRPTDPDYDKTTIYIDERDHRQMTVTQKQYWEIKRKNFDTIIFFQVGSFYELYETDAVIGARIMDLKMNRKKPNMGSVGVPLSAYELWASKFVALGYKVARVDQVAKTSADLDAGNEKRSVVHNMSFGTLVQSDLLGPQSNYMMAVIENIECKSYGVCFVDCSVGEFLVGNFADDTNRTLFETMLNQIQPREVLYCRDHLSTRSHQLIRTCLPQPLVISSMVMGSGDNQFWEASYLEERLTDGVYFSPYCENPEPSPSPSPSSSQKKTPLPELLHKLLQNPLDNYMLLTALGGCVSYLRKTLLDHKLLPQGNFKFYNVLDQEDHLMLDGQTLINLDILQNSFDHSANKTLFGLMMHCVTDFGQRMFRRWMCRPLRSPLKIRERLDAIEDLYQSFDFVENLVKSIKELPDLERLLSRLHSRSLSIESLMTFVEGIIHLDSIIRRVQEGVTDRVLESFETTSAIDNTFQSPLLRKLLLTKTSGGEFPDLGPLVNLCCSTVDIEASKTLKKLIPMAGTNKKYEELSETIDRKLLNKEDLLRQLQREIGSSLVTFYPVPLKRFNESGLSIKDHVFVEVPKKALKNGTHPKHWILFDDNKALIRCAVPVPADSSFDGEEIRELEMEKDQVCIEFEEEFTQVLINIHNSIRDAIERVAQFDCLVSLMKTSFCSGNHMSRPVLLGTPNTKGEGEGEGATESQDEQLIEALESYHPYLHVNPEIGVIPNDIHLGGASSPPGLLLTGPNMGGKSTLLRQACIIVIMAQMGCYVPASSCRLSTFDRIFTRLGANDNIFEGQSTFMVELQETSNILQLATRKSLVILDELGRGTSTFDGMAIAHAVVHHLVLNVRCLMMFATHYHLLVDDWKQLSRQISLFFMDCVVNEKDHDTDAKRVTFLYKCKEGFCPRSYGMNVALLAGLPKTVVEKASLKASQFESQVSSSRSSISRDNRHLFQRVTQSLFSTSPSELSLDILQQLQVSVRQHFAQPSSSPV